MAANPTARDKLLDAAVKLIRMHGFTATRVDQLCAEAGVTKGAFFHHFSSKQALGAAAADYWSEMTGQLFASAPYHDHDDPLDRVIGYIDFREQLIAGDTCEFTCLVGTMVQEVYDDEPEIRDACASSIFSHADTLTADIQAAMDARDMQVDFSAVSLARHTQAVLQGGFILAKASKNSQLAIDTIAHLKRYIAGLFQPACQSTTH